MNKLCCGRSVCLLHQQNFCQSSRLGLEQKIPSPPWIILQTIDGGTVHEPMCSQFAETESCANFHVAGTEKIDLISEICLYPVDSNLKFNFHTKNSLHADRLYSLKIRHFLGSKFASLRNYSTKTQYFTTVNFNKFHTVSENLLVCAKIVQQQC